MSTAKKGILSFHLCVPNPLTSVGWVNAQQVIRESSGERPGSERQRFLSDMKQILPRGGGAFLATGTGTGTFSSGTGFLGTAGTLKTWSIFRTWVLFHWSSTPNTDTHSRSTHITELTKSSFALEHKMVKMVLGERERQYLLVVELLPLSEGQVFFLREVSSLVFLALKG